MHISYAGIDPGKTGAIAVVSKDENYVVFDMPWIGEYVDVQELYSMLPSHGMVIIEKSHVMRGQGITSSGNYMRGYGQIIACLQLKAIPFREVSSCTWKRAFNLFKKSKDESRRVASQYFPNADLSLKKHHGRAEALLMAQYGRMIDRA